jgi:hypothetical protein
MPEGNISAIFNPDLNQLWTTDHFNKARSIKICDSKKVKGTTEICYPYSKNNTLEINVSIP